MSVVGSSSTRRLTNQARASFGVTLLRPRQLNLARRLHWIASRYASYYNEACTLLSLAKDAPISRPIELFGYVTAEPLVGGLRHRYGRV
jgi:hypothetical protein